MNATRRGFFTSIAAALGLGCVKHEMRVEYQANEHEGWEWIRYSNRQCAYKTHKGFTLMLTRWDGESVWKWRAEQGGWPYFKSDASTWRKAQLAALAAVDRTESPPCSSG